MDSLEKSLVELKNAMDRHESKESWAQGLSRWKDKEGDIKKNGIDLDIQEDDLEAFFKGFGAEIHPLVKLQKAVQNGVIHSFKAQSVPEMHGKWRKNMCEWCDEDFGENGYSGHECKEMRHGNFIFIFNEGREDELLAMIKPLYKLPLDRQNSTHTSIPIIKEPSIQQLSENRTNHLNNPRVNEKIEDNICENFGIYEEIEGKIDLKLKEDMKDMCEEQIIIHEENLEYQEYQNVEEKEEIKVSIMDKNQSQKNREKGRKKGKKHIKNLGKKKIKKGKVGAEKFMEKKEKKKEVQSKQCKENKCRTKSGNTWRQSVIKVWKCLFERNYKRKKIGVVLKVGKLGQVCNGSGGGPGRRRRNKGKTKAPAEEVGWRKTVKSKSKKKSGFVGIKKLNRNGRKEGIPLAMQETFGWWWMSAGEVNNESVGSSKYAEPSAAAVHWVGLCDKKVREEKRGGGDGVLKVIKDAGKYGSLAGKPWGLAGWRKKKEKVAIILGFLKLKVKRRNVDAVDYGNSAGVFSLNKIMLLMTSLMTSAILEGVVWLMTSSIQKMHRVAEILEFNCREWAAKNFEF